MSIKINRDIKYLKSARSKIILTSLLILSALGIYFTAYNLVFREIIQRVEILGTPDSRLLLTRDLYQTFIQADQDQRKEVLSGGSLRSGEVDKYHDKIYILLDSLSVMDQEDTSQQKKIEEIKVLLKARESLFQAFISAKQNFLYSNFLDENIKSLSDLLYDNLNLVDTQIIEYEQSKATENYLPADSLVVIQESSPGFFQRIFGKKTTVTIDTIVSNVLNTRNEQVTNRVDTLKYGASDEMKRDLMLEVDQLVSKQKTKGNKMVRQELAFLNATVALSSQILQILHQFEYETIEHLEKNTSESGDMVRELIRNSNLWLIIFLFIIGVLLFLILLDISHSAKYRRLLDIEKEKSEKVLKQKEKFLANISHEIRTPLQSILGYSELVKEQDNPDKESLDIIHRSSDYLLHIVNELLDYSSIVAGKLTFRQDHFSINSLTENVIKVLEPQALEKGISLRLESEGIVADAVKGDSFRYQQLLFNLIGNAIKFTANGHVTVSTSTKLVNAQCVLSCSVKDTGPGISPEDLNKIFLEFERINDDNGVEAQGTGLGLSIVKAIIEAWGGTLQVQSEKGIGTTFSFQLKLDIAHEEAADSGFFQNRDYYGTDTEQQIVLVIDDDKFILNMCKQMLDKEGVSNITTSDPLIALDLLQEESLAMILMDIRMPAMNGQDLLKLMRKSTNVPIIAMTAERPDNTDESNEFNDFDMVLYKPFKAIELRNVLKRSLCYLSLDSARNFDNQSTMLDYFSEELRHEIIRDCLNQSVVDIEYIMELDDNWDPIIVADKLHTLASRLGQIGNMETCNILRDFESRLRNSSSERSQHESADCDNAEVIGKLKAIKANLVHQLSEVPSDSHI